MSNMKRYNLFILMSTIARNIVEVFSSVLLYKMGYTLQNILLFFSVLYFTGFITSIITMYLTKIIKEKYILMLSSIIFSFSFYFMSVMDKTIVNLIIFGIIYGIGSYTYHILRHYFALKAMHEHKKEDIGSILIYTNIAVIFSSLIASYIQSKLSLITLAIIIIVISVIATIFLFKFNESCEENKIEYPHISIKKALFFIFEQAKVINLSLQPLFLYLYVDGSLKYIGLFNVFLGISSCLFIYFFVRKINDKKYFKYLNIIFCIFLILKLNVKNKYLMLVIALFEGLGIKMFDIVSAENIYNVNRNVNIKGYLIITETIFCLVRCLICIISYFINNIKIILYISIAFILVVGFINRENPKVK